MELVNTTPYRFHAFDCSMGPTLPALSLIVKGTFRLKADEAAEALGEKEQQGFRGDETYMDDLGRSLSYATDLVAFKARGEVTVSATCYAEGGRPRAECDVAIGVGPIHKTLRVSGDRRWSKGGARSIGPTQPFESMSLRWERAFGSLSFGANPLGRGVEPSSPDPADDAIYLPNVEYPQRRVTSANDRPPPAGFGPVSPNWLPRAQRQGTRDQRWAAFRAPLPPLDFDARFYNAAPDDQQLDEGTFFRGDEPVTLTNLHRELPQFSSRLPGKRLRVFLSLRGPGESPRFVEAPMCLDTVAIDAEKDELVLVWRRPVKVSSPAHPEIEAVYIAEEDLATEPLSPAEHYARYRTLRPVKLSEAEAMQAEMDAQMAEANKVLRESNVDPKLTKQVEETKDPKDVLTILMQFAQLKILELEAATAKLKSSPRKPAA
ncbi:MAG: DUF2169 domain-containing protein [Polyangiaceae bacterium]|nr:DUF2169 domain-containing protein [Polyangiaceae bacterium]